MSSMRFMRESRKSPAERRLIASILLAIEAEALVSAAKIDDLLAVEDNKKFEDDLRAINAADTTPTKKYLNWGLSRLKAGDTRPLIIEAFQHFERSARYLPAGAQRDIFWYRTLPGLRSALDSAEAEHERREREKAKAKERDLRLRRMQKNAKYETLYSDEEFELVHPHNMEASCYHGGSTVRWCISYTESSNYFNRYSSENKFFYFIISKKRPSTDDLHKVALVLQKGNKSFVEAWNAADAQIGLGRTISELGPDVLDLVKVAYKHMAKQDNTWQYDLQTTDDPNKLRALYERFKNSNDSTRVNAALAEKLATPTDILLELSNSSDPKVASMAIKNPSFPAERLDDFANSTDPSIITLIASKSTNPTVLKEIALQIKPKGEPGPFADESANQALTAALSRNPHLPPESLIHLAKHGQISYFNSDAFLRRPDLPTEALLALCDRGEVVSSYSQLIAGHPNANDEVISKLLASTFIRESTKRDLISSAKLSQDLFTRLLQTQDMHPYLANNSNLSQEQIRQLAETSSAPQVILALLKNKSTPSDVLLRIVQAPGLSPEQRSRLALHPNISPESLDALSTEVTANNAEIILAVVLNRATPPGTLQRIYNTLIATPNLLGWRGEGVMVSLAANPNTPATVLEQLAASGKYGAALVRNPAATAEMLRRAVSDVSIRARELASHPNLPADFAEKMLNIDYNSRTTKTDVLSKLVSNPACPIDIVVKLSKLATEVGKAAKKALEARPDKPPPSKRGRKPKVVAPTTVEAMSEVADILHLLGLPAPTILAMEEAVDLLT